MARQTDNLQLTLYAATDNPLVKEWRESLNLDNENSALSKIDVFAGDINTRVQTLENRPDAVRVNATSDDGINYTATVSNFSNPQDGAIIRLSVDLENTGGATLYINGSAYPITKPIDTNGKTNINASDLLVNRIYTLIYDDGDWIILGGMFPSEYSKSDHRHDMDYAPLMHNHDAEYSAIDHTHDGYADKDHTHDNYVTTNTNQSITGVKQFETYPTLPTGDPSSTNPISLSYANGAYLGISDSASDSNKLNGQLASYYVNTSASQTIGGVKTFTNLPALPSTTPGATNPIRKDYADANYVGLTGNETIAGVKTFSSLPVLPTSTPTTNNAIRKGYADSTYVGMAGNQTVDGEKIFSSRPKSTGSLPLVNKEDYLATIQDAQDIAFEFRFVPSNVSIYRTTSQNISRISWTYLLWSTEEYDVGNMWSSGQNYVTIPSTGIYTVSCSWASDTNISSDAYGLTALFVNETTPTNPFMTQLSYYHPTTGIYTVYSITSKFNSKQMLRIGVYHYASSSINVGSTVHPTRLKVTKVSD